MVDMTKALDILKDIYFLNEGDDDLHEGYVSSLIATGQNQRAVAIAKKYYQTHKRGFLDLIYALEEVEITKKFKISMMSKASLNMMSDA